MAGSQCPALGGEQGTLCGSECHQPGDVPCSGDPDKVQGPSVALPPARCAQLCPHTLSRGSHPCPHPGNAAGAALEAKPRSLHPPWLTTDLSDSPAPGFPGNEGWEHLRLPVPAAVPGHGSPQGTFMGFMGPLMGVYFLYQNIYT